MMKYTDTHFRYLMRLMSQSMGLYTEMLTTDAVLHGKPHLVNFHAVEHPVALQLGGSDPDALARCAEKAEALGYDEVNLNCGCPSDRVQAGQIGACLMGEPALVARCVQAMRKACDLPITVKTRTGIDKQEGYEFLKSFADPVVDAGVDALIVHARKAWLQGLNPKENREIPPLEYEKVYQLKDDYPELQIIINGGIKSMEAVSEHLRHVDGVMLGRLAYEDTYQLARVDNSFFNAQNILPARQELVDRYMKYAQVVIASGVCPGRVLKPLWGLSHGCPGGKHWRRALQDLVHDVKREGYSKTLWDKMVPNLPGL